MGRAVRIYQETLRYMKGKNNSHYVQKNILPYYKIIRTDHWFKNIFVVPGVVIAWIFTKINYDEVLGPFSICIVSICLLASANYTINEYLDSSTDKFHPLKKLRPGARGQLKFEVVLLLYLVLVSIGCYLASLVNLTYLGFSVVFLFMGLVYNVPPIRAKDRVYLDVLSESLNNPLRLLLGWLVVAPHLLPPSSLILAYWMFGAFMMTVKRLAEYRFISDSETARLYRSSFAFYNENKLIVAAFLYSLLFSFCFATFVIKYRTELILGFPLLCLILSYYMWIGLKKNSIAQKPEKMYREHKFVAFLVITCIMLVSLLVLEIPILHTISNPHPWTAPWSDIVRLH